MSLDDANDVTSWIYLDEVSVVETGVADSSALMEYTFETGDEGWQLREVPPLDLPISSVSGGFLGLSPNGSTDCFGFFCSPEVAIEHGKVYAVEFQVGSSVTDADEAVHFRLRVNQKGSWQAWEHMIESFNQLSPTSIETKPYRVLFAPKLIWAGDTTVLCSFDLMSFTSDNDTFSWLYLDSVSFKELLLSP